ncbi:DUF262 domain-containing protein [Sphingobacterium sp. SGL-16]|nr:DUF262 domain-containing protein [Sphingobacterium sp. SGL-16]
MVEQNELLLKEIEIVRKEIKTDNFSMAIRELVQVYRDGDLELFPSYQRLFRWDDNQKTRFIESLLMGMPTPPIFIAQTKGSKWTIVDGLQRMCTVLETMGLLKKSKHEESVLAPLNFTHTEKLPSIEGLNWITLNADAQRIIKMSKLDLKIILVEDNVQAQYELFKRLNTGAVVLQPQEIRNCLIIMVNEDFYNHIEDLKTFPPFVKAINISDAKTIVEFPMELILRYFISKKQNLDFSEYNISNELLSDFIDKETIKLLNDKNFNIIDEIALFKRVFKLLNQLLGEKTFKKYVEDKDEFEGAFLQSSFEAILPGLSHNIEFYENEGKVLLLDRIKKMYSQPQFIQGALRGKKALVRIKELKDFSQNYFANDN